MIRLIFTNILMKMRTLSEEMSLWEELWAYLEGKYFSVDLGQYEHLNLGSGTLISLRNVILGICVGIIIASIMMAYEKNKMGKFVRAVIKEQCFWPDKAMTLEQLGFQGNSAVKSNLRRSSSVLSKVVKCVEREAFQKEVSEMREAYIAKNGSDKGFEEPVYKIDLYNAHFYIPDDEHYAADIRYDNQGSGWRAFLLVIIITTVIAILVCFLLPDMLQMVDNMIDILKGDGNVLN